MSLQLFLAQFALDDLFLLENPKESKTDYGIIENTSSIENLIKLHNDSKLLFPSYLIRFGAFDNVTELDEKALNVLLESGSMMAYDELKNRYGINLSKAPDEFLVIGAQRNGDLERNILTRNYEPIIERIIKRVDKRYYFKGQEKEDLIQEAFMGFLKAIEVYKIERRTKFKDFSHYVIQRHLGTLMNRSKNYRNRALNESFSFNIPVNNSSGNDTTFEELIEGSTASPEKIIEDEKTFEEICEMFTENEQEVFDYYSDGYTYEEIAFELMVDKGQIDFSGMAYEEVSNSIKLYEAYSATLENMHKQLARKVASEITTLVEAIFFDMLENDVTGTETIANTIEHINELEFDIQIDDNRKWNSEFIMGTIKNTISEQLLSEEMKGIMTNLLQHVQESSEYQKYAKKIKTLIEKNIASKMFKFSQENVVFSETEIANKVFSLELQLLKEMTPGQIANDIHNKFTFVNNDGLTWKEIANEMKRKKKSVDNTIQRIRNKGHQYNQEFEEIMKKELTR